MNIEIKSYEKSPAFRMRFRQNGRIKSWDLIGEKDRVVSIIFNETSQKLVFVKQFRPAIFYNRIVEVDKSEKPNYNEYSPELGTTLELCGGSIKSCETSALDTAKDRILKEANYDVPISKIQEINTHFYSVGVMGNKQTLFYCEVTDDMKVADSSDGVQMHESVELTVPEIKKLIEDDQIIGSPVLARWFMESKVVRNVFK